MKVAVVFAVCLALVAVAVGEGCMLSFTGDAHADFYVASQDDTHPCSLFVDPQNNVENYADDSEEVRGAEERDVGVPDFFVGHAGWDMRGTFVSWCSDMDALQVGWDCYGICGDPDNDGDPDNTDLDGVMSGNSGVDIADMQMTETFLLIIDIDRDNYEFGFFQPPHAIGWPSAAFAASNFGLYEFNPSSLQTSPLSGIIYDDPTFADGQTHPIEWNISAVVYPHDGNGLMDIEFTVYDWSDLEGYPEDWDPVVDGIYFQFQSFAGSFQDDGVGEETMPAAESGFNYTVPGCILDACGVCDGPPTDDCGLCIDHPDYGNSRDPDCDQCGGAGFDQCGICPHSAGYEEPLDMCNKCYNEPNYGECDCCGCDDEPFSGLTYDQCDECGGDGSSCCTPESYKGVAMWDIDRMLVYYEVHHTMTFLEMMEDSLWWSITQMFEYEWEWSQDLTEAVPFCDVFEALMVYDMCCQEFASQWMTYTESLWMHSEWYMDTMDTMP